MRRRPAITVVGSSNIDFVTLVPHLPAVGETVTDGDFKQTFGGKGANQAVAAARAGGDVTFVTCLGNDPYAPVFRESLRGDGIPLDHVGHDPSQPSGTALVMVGPRGANYLAVAPGTNSAVTPERVRAAGDVIARSRMVVLQMEIPVAANEAATDLAGRHGVPVMLNYAPVRGKPMAVDGRIGILVVNEQEAGELCGKAAVKPQDAPAAAAALRAMGPRCVVITLGGAGAYVLAEDARAHVPAFPVDAVDTTAAGDTFCGTLAVALAEGEAILPAARRASAAAALSVSRAGAQPSIPTRQQVEAYLASAAAR